MKITKKLQILIVCIIVMPIFFISQLDGSIKITPIYPQSSYTITNNSICIDASNASSLFDRGTGIDGDPYVLENKVVNISNGEYGIKIIGVNYITIQNCTITAEESILSISHGIYIDNCDNATIYNNTIADITLSAYFDAIYIENANSANITENNIYEISTTASYFYGINIGFSSLYASIVLNHIFAIESANTIYAIETFSDSTNISRNTLDHLQGNRINCITTSSSDNSYITWNNISRFVSLGSDIRCFYNITSTNLVIENNFAMLLLQNIDMGTAYEDTNTVIHANANEIANVTYTNTTELIVDHQEYLFNITYNYTAYLENPTYELYLLNASDDSVIFNQTESFNGTNSGNIVRYHNLTIGTYYGYFVINETNTLIIPAYRFPYDPYEYINAINIYPVIDVTLSEDKINVIWTIEDDSINNPTYKIYVNYILMDSGAWDGESNISYPIDNSERGIYSYLLVVDDGYGGISMKGIIFAIHEDGGIPDTDDIHIETDLTNYQKFLKWIFENFLLIILAICMFIALLIIWKIIKKRRAEKAKEAKKLKCPLCPEEFLSIESLDKHLIAMHGYSADYKSNIQSTL